MVTKGSLIEELKNYLNDPYVYYCGCGIAFEKARSKTVEIVYDIPYCFSILGIMQKHFFIDEVYMVGYKESDNAKKEILDKYSDASIIYMTSDREKVIAALYNDNETIKFSDEKEYKFEDLVFDNGGNLLYKKESEELMDLVVNYLSDEQLEKINEVMYSTIRDWKDKDDLYNMMY